MNTPYRLVSNISRRGLSSSSKRLDSRVDAGIWHKDVQAAQAIAKRFQRLAVPHVRLLGTGERIFPELLVEDVDLVLRLADSGNEPPRDAGRD